MFADVNYSNIRSTVYNEVKKRKELWGIDESVKTIHDQNFKVFYDFVVNALNFLSVRENPELFGYMNEFYNMILKSIYLMSLSYKNRIYAK